MLYRGNKAELAAVKQMEKAEASFAKQVEGVKADAERRIAKLEADLTAKDSRTPELYEKLAEPAPARGVFANHDNEE